MLAPEVEGVRETLASLKQFDAKLERAHRKSMRVAVAPLQNRVRAKLPDEPMSGWKSGRYAYSRASASSGVKVSVGGRKSSRKAVWPLVTMVQKNAGGSVFDMAGRRSGGKSPQGRQFIRNLNRDGKASRSMWAAADEGKADVEKGVLAGIEEAEKSLNREMQ